MYLVYIIEVISFVRFIIQNCRSSFKTEWDHHVEPNHDKLFILAANNSNDSKRINFLVTATNRFVRRVEVHGTLVAGDFLYFRVKFYCVIKL